MQKAVSENTVILFICAPNCLCFLLGPLYIPRESGNNAYAKILGGGTNKKSIMVFSEVAYVG